VSDNKSEKERKRFEKWLTYEWVWFRRWLWVRGASPSGFWDRVVAEVRFVAILTWKSGWWWWLFFCLQLRLKTGNSDTESRIHLKKRYVGFSDACRIWFGDGRKDESWNDCWKLGVDCSDVTCDMYLVRWNASPVFDILCKRVWSFFKLFLARSTSFTSFFYWVVPFWIDSCCLHRV